MIPGYDPDKMVCLFVNITNVTMKCPNCNETLLMSVRNQVEIDYCPSCRGIWLDRGELDKIISYAEREETNASRNPSGDWDRDRDRPKYDDRYHQSHPRKKKSFLGDFFDFD